MTEGYLKLLGALDEAHAGTGLVDVAILGEDREQWTTTTGDHLERDGTLHVGGGIVVFPDSTCVGRRNGAFEWRGGHTMPDGERLERFLADHTAMTLRWSGPAPRAG